MSEPQNDRHLASGTDLRVGRDDGVRLELKPDLSRGGFVDGAWWPRSRDLSTELPDLVAAIGARWGRHVGPILRVGFGIGQWDTAGRRLETPSGRVVLDGFAEFGADLVRVVSRSNALTPIVLLVVPPGTPHDQAVDTLRRASAEGNVDRPAALLGQQDTGSVPRDLVRGAGPDDRARDASYTVVEVMR